MLNTCRRSCRQETGTPRWTRSVATAALGRRVLLGGVGLCCCSRCSSSRRAGWYDKYFAFNMAFGMQEYEAAILPVKQQLFSQLFAGLTQEDSSTSAHQATGSASNKPLSLLEVGIGTGPNLPFYLPTANRNSSSSSSPPGLKVTGLEPNTAMWGYTQQAAAAAGLLPHQLQLVQGDAQQMPFDSSSFDAAVMTLVLCSVSDPLGVLSEVLRVLRPGGQLLLIEHVIAPHPSFLQFQQRLFDPLQRLLADNCHLTRDTAALVHSSSFSAQALPPLPDLLNIAAATDIMYHSSNGIVGDVSGRHIQGSSGGLWQFEVDGMGLIAPHVAGLLQKPL